MEAFAFSLTFCSILVAVPVGVLFVEVMAACLLRSRQDESIGRNLHQLPSVAVIVPAHNEGADLLPTLSDIKQQLRPGDRLLVVADNCVDDTAANALRAGAEVIERHDPANAGKGFALNFGVQHLRIEPPDIVIIIDADCRLADRAIDNLANNCATVHRPVQALDLMTAPDGAKITRKIAEFAWRVKNWLRPSGLAALGLPCQLMGTGMAFPWDIINAADLASESIVEDLKLGLDLTAMGHPPVFCPSAVVTSCFASSEDGERVQRSRWESGHIHMIAKTVPRLLGRAALRPNLRLLALTLDLAVPPLSLLALTNGVMFVFASFCAIAGVPSYAFRVSSTSVLIFFLTACVAWFKCGRDVVPIQLVPSIAAYILGKLPLYRTLLSRKPARWVRTDRKNSNKTN